MAKQSGYGHTPAMPNLKVEIDITGYVAEVDQACNKDIPFVTAKALTRSAQDGQIEMRRQVAQVFTLRNAWTQQGFRITPAQKLSWPIQSEVYTATANDSTGAGDYLILQDDGGQKELHGHENFAIPTKYLRAIAPGPIPAALRPKNLLPADSPIGVTHSGRLDAPLSPSTSRYGKLSKRKIKEMGSAEFVAFKQYDHRGTLCIFVRIKGKRDPEPWYVLTPRASVKAALQMVPTIEKVVNDRYEQHWDDAWAELNP